MKKIICIILALAIPLSFYGCNGFHFLKRYSTTVSGTFDTVTNIVAYDESEAEFNRKAKIVNSEIERYDRLFDIYTEHKGITNLCTVNKTAKDGPVKVDKDIIELLKYGLDAYKKSNGRVNICYGAVLSQWHDAIEKSEADRDNVSIPEKKTLEKLSRHTNPDDLVIDEKKSTVYIKDSQLTLDVGAIAKGWSAQKIADKLVKEKLWENFMLNLGGNVVTRGFKKGNGKSKWNIQIANPDRTNSETALETLELTNLAVVTSGDYQRYFTVKGLRFSHIIDVKTMAPGVYFSSVTVICEDSALGDRLSTELFVTPLEEGKKTVEALDGVEALWVGTAGKKTYSSGFEKYKAQ